MPKQAWLIKSESEPHLKDGVDVSYSFQRLLEEKQGPLFGGEPPTQAPHSSSAQH
jgi:hypothetical protein